MPRNYGHMQGAKTVEEMCEVARDLGIKYFTVYAFSTENWKRPQSEVMPDEAFEKVYGRFP